MKNNEDLKKEYSLELYELRHKDAHPEYRDALTQEGESGTDLPKPVTYTNTKGSEVATVYLHDLCELE